MRQVYSLTYITRQVSAQYCTIATVQYNATVQEQHEMNMIEAGAPPTESAEMHLDCPTCGYLLTGLPEDRCPECGIVFDRARLLLTASPDTRPVHTWNDRSTFGLVGAFCRTCMATWFHPGRFAGSFPRRHSSRSAWGFSLMCYGVAFAVLLFPMMMRSESGGYGATIIQATTFMVFIFPGVVVAAIGCEWLIARVLSRHFHVPNIPRADAYHFWRGLTHFFSSYFILSGIGFALWEAAPGRTAPNSGNPLFDIVFFSSRGVIPIVFLWWVFSLNRAMAARTSPEPQLLTLATIVLVLIGLGAILAGTMLANLGFGVFYALL